ncbi:copper amine oxidase N-terminal domain-containing protein [Paenibacillus sp. N3.4]|uniref:copper amine oxidase N-terminal domain-containing protein n=1 Tax=Paenibacillus sp. N3.4 TaxID=2603222 RepID=UPI0021C3DC0F|nr:copper amine oxidase N-terminal domain-containing protein [Paenibacillus sp. N3.4]
MKKSLVVLALSSMMTTGAAYAATNDAVAVPTNSVLPVVTQASSQAITIQVNGQSIAEHGYQKPAGKEPMLPLRAVTETLGFDLTWNQETMSVDLKKNNTFTTVKTGEDRYVINKMFTSLGVAPELVDNKLYVPASFVSEVLHGSVAAKGSAVSIELAEQVKHVQTTGVITSINQSVDYASIHIQGVGTEGIVLNVGKDTTYRMLDDTALKLSDLHVGLTVSAEHSEIATLSLPPQTPTYRITVLDTNRQTDMLGTSGLIEEVQQDDQGNVSVHIKGAGLNEQTPNEVVLHLNKDTSLINKDGEVLEKSALIKGAQVIGFYKPVLTKSLPPIGTLGKSSLAIKPSSHA